MHSILIVDDNNEILETYKLMLEDEVSCELILVESAKSAIEYLELNSPKLIITDYYMPELNGSAVVQYNQKNKNLPIIMCSSGQRDEYDDLNNFEEDNDINCYIQKPFELDHLLQLINKAIG